MRSRASEAAHLRGVGSVIDLMGRRGGMVPRRGLDDQAREVDRTVSRARAHMKPEHYSQKQVSTADKRQGNP